MKRYRIGDIAERTGLTERTIRYYGELGLLAAERTEGGQRTYTDMDIVYLKRIQELKALGFKLDEIVRVVKMKTEDESGAKRRSELLSAYRMKLSEDRKRIEELEKHVEELEWHIRQLEEAGEDFRSCPGSLCASCSYSDKCVFFKKS